MARLNYDNLVRLCEAHGTDAGRSLIREQIKAKELTPQEFSFEALFEACFGVSTLRHCVRTGKLVNEVFMEAEGATSTASFQQISGQIVYSLVMQAYQSEDNVFSKIIPERQSPYSFEKVAGITPIGDEATVVKEGTDFPLAGVGETYQHFAETQKRGFKVALTREAVFFDRTGQLLDRARDVGAWLGVNREKRAIDCAIDEGGGAVSAINGGHRYHFRGNSISTYGNDSGNHNWDNLAASNALVDWTDVDNVDQLFNEILDPDSREPVLITPKHLWCAKSLEQAALRIRNATEITVTTPGYATSGNPTETKVANPMGGKFDVITSRLFAQRLGIDTSWFYGDLTKAFLYIVNWPMQVKQLASGTQVEFDRDIAMQFRADERGNYTTVDARMAAGATA